MQAEPTSTSGKPARKSAKRDALLATAERLFYVNGFHATGIDLIVKEAGVTPRTLYNHFASKNALVHAVLRQREQRYFEAFDRIAAKQQLLHDDPVVAAFEALRHWLSHEAAGGCMFLAALAEYANLDPEVVKIVVDHKSRVLEGLRQRLAIMGAADNDKLAGSLLLLMEGAIALAPVLGADSVLNYALDAAKQLMNNTQNHSGTSNQELN